LLLQGFRSRSCLLHQRGVLLRHTIHLANGVANLLDTLLLLACSDRNLTDDRGRGADMARISVIEDSPVNMEVLTVLLSNEGHELFLAERALPGIEIARQQPLDLILMDINMPGVGIEAAKMLRAHPTTRHSIDCRNGLGHGWRPGTHFGRRVR
jgi:hypothetical protein